MKIKQSVQHLLTGYGMEARLASHMPSICTEGTVVRWVTAATMTGYQDLSEIERGVIFGAREMGHIISELVRKFRLSSTIISRLYRENQESGKTSNLRHRCGRKKIIQELNQ
ncbi:HTH_Tnp_Tc3_2 domain-containing protein [Trichonephila clavipes]|nr:HTH_Tnp_Tc3_2 domain-containing protein [Trichonephila clavipes]